MKAIYSKSVFQLIITTDVLRSDGQPYTLIVRSVGSPNDARRLLQEIGFWVDLEEQE
jgi:hypothetical protein